MASTTGYNHLFWHEFRSLPKGSVGIRIHSAILLCQRSTASAQCLAGKHLLPNWPTSTAKSHGKVNPFANNA